MKFDSQYVIVPPGEYFIGDPCYGVPDGLWHDLLDSCNYFKSPIGQIEHDGKMYNVLGFGTKWGDGTYPSNIDADVNFPVDAGLIGVVPVDLALAKDAKPFGMYRVMFDQPTMCYEDDGTLVFGQIKIFTNDNEEDEDPFEDEYGFDDEEDL